MKKPAIAFSSAAFAAVGLTVLLGAQAKPPASPSDYGQWESLQLQQNRGGLSPDGRQIAFVINKSNRDSELRIATVADGAAKVTPFGAQPVFSADSHWAAYAIGVSEAQDEKLKKEKKPVRKKAGLLNLQSGAATTIDDVESFAFDASGTHLAMRHYAPEPEKKSGDAAPGEPSDAPAGATLVVRDLASGRDTTLGNVGEFAWQDKGPLLAVTISTNDKAGNGVQLLNPQTGTLRVLDSASSVYSGLAWRKESADLALLRSKTDDRHDGPTETALAWTRIGESGEARHAFDPAPDPPAQSFPTGMRTVPFRKPTWSDDGKVVFLGVAKWTDSPAPARRTTTNQASDDLHGQNPPISPASADDDEPAGVDVWHWKDISVIPRQKLSAKTDRERSMLAAWHLDSGRFVQLGKTLAEQVTPVKHQSFAYAANWSAYEMDRTIGRGAADLWTVDLATGERTKLKDRVDDRHAQVSPSGRYLLYLLDDQFWTVDLTSHATTNITKAVATTFIDRESDQTIKQKPPFGVGGWTKNDGAVLLYDKFDIWQIAPDGSRATRLTNGAADQVRHRMVRLNPDEDTIDPDKPQYVSLFGIWTKKSGYARLQLGAQPAVDRLVWLDKSVTRLAKAKDADVYAYVQEAFDDSPDVFVGGGDLKDAKQLTKTNAFADRFAWGRSEIVEYRNEKGERLQGALYYPAGYEPGKRYPMIVYMYERLSDNVHRYVPPSERDPYNAGAFTSLGYFVLEPDIVFRPREPGLSVADCVGAAVRKVLAGGAVDPRRVGIVGHSWGGFDSTFLATHSDLFAAAVAGAPITDLVSNYGNHHWSSGIAETDHIETGQQRMEVPLWEDLPAYIRNSALFNVQNMKTPLMIEVGDADGTVFWHQGIELYNAARRAKKEVVLLSYAGEDHGLRKKPNQLDYHRRIVEWFGHYLQGESAPSWIANGVSYLDREQELKQLKAKKPR